MKKILITVIAIATLVGCKKGENDPGISFRGRDARVIGEWTLSSYEHKENTSTISSSGNSTTSVNVTYDGKKYTTTKSPGTVPADNVTYDTKIDIQKQGIVVYTLVATSGNNTATVVEEGTWVWANSHKNKSTIVLSISGDQSGRNYFTGGTYNVDQLKNKEVVLIRSNEGSNKSTGVAGSEYTYSSSTTATLTQ